MPAEAGDLHRDRLGGLPARPRPTRWSGSSSATATSRCTSPRTAPPSTIRRWRSGGRIDDPLRVDYYREHLRAVHDGDPAGRRRARLLRLVAARQPRVVARLLEALRPGARRTSRRRADAEGQRPLLRRRDRVAGRRPRRRPTDSQRPLLRTAIAPGTTPHERKPTRAADVRRRHGARPAGGLLEPGCPTRWCPTSCATRSTTRARPTRRRARRADGAADVSERNLPLPPLFDDIERRTFDFFWGIGNPVNGLVPDRHPTKSPCSIAAVGFALTAYVIGVDRGFISASRRASARSPPCASSATRRKVRRPRGKTGHKGFFYHFLDMKTGARAWRSELSTVDTALLLAGMLHAQAYFDAEHPERGRDPRMRSTRSTGASTGSGRRCAAGSSAWAGSPRRASSRTTGRGYNEAMLVVLLALGSPTHPVGESAWSAWSEQLRHAWGRFMGYEHLSFAPLFGHQYSHVWIDFRGIRDATMRERGIDYFENTRRAVYAQRAYAIANPKGWLRIRRQRLGLHRLRRPRQAARARPRATASATTSTTRRAAPAARHHRRRHDRADRGAVVAAVRARDRDPGRRGDARALRQVHLLEVRLPRFVQPQLHRHRRQAQRRPRRSRPSAGSPTTTSASTRARSWR